MTNEEEQKQPQTQTSEVPIHISHSQTYEPESGRDRNSLDPEEVIEKEGLLSSKETKENPIVKKTDSEGFSEIDLEATKGVWHEDERKTRRTNLYLTATYCFNYMALGLAFGSVGPSLFALSHNTNTTIETIGSIFTARGLGWLIGSAIAGKLFEVYNGNRLMFIALSFQTLLTLILPFLGSLWTVFTISAILSGFMSWIDVGANSLMMGLWREHAGPYMQFLHFAFGVGSTLAPFIIGIFISWFKGTPQSALWAYFPLGVITMFTGIPLLILKTPAFQKGDSHGSTTTSSTTTNNHITEENEGDNTTTCNNNKNFNTASEKTKKIMYYLTISLISFYLFLYVGAESSYGGWIFTYAVRIYDFSEASAAYLSSAFWGAITFGRLLAVPISVKVSAKMILFTDMIASISCVLILIAFSSVRNQAILWALTLALGLSMASIFATALSLPANLNIAMNPRATSILIVGASMGDMVMPMIAGWLMGFIGSNSLLMIVLGLFIPATTIYFIVLFGLSRWYDANKKRVGEQEFELISNTGEE